MLGNLKICMYMVCRNRNNKALRLLGNLAIFAGFLHFSVVFRNQTTCVCVAHLYDDGSDGARRFLFPGIVCVCHTEFSESPSEHSIPSPSGKPVTTVSPSPHGMYPFCVCDLHVCPYVVMPNSNLATHLAALRRVGSR